MATYIIVTDGPMKGERFEIKGGERVGRDQGEIVLNDPKVSHLHALIKKSLLGQLTLADQKSKNGIIFEGKQVDRVKLNDGVEFRIGANSFKVETATKDDKTHTKVILSGDLDETALEAPFLLEQSTDELSASPELSENEDTFLYSPHLIDSKEESEIIETASIIDSEKTENDEGNTESKKEEFFDLEKDNISSLSLKELTTKGKTESKLSFRTLDQQSDEESPGLFEEEKKTWSRVLERHSRKSLKVAMDHPQNIEALKPRVKLTFFRGTQAETEWELGYGPRTAGSASTDLPIWEPAAPQGDCFVISPSESGPRFSTKFPNVVKINGQSVEEVTLTSGDVISIAETEIEVELF